MARLRYCMTCEDHTPSLGGCVNSDLLELHRAVHYLADLVFFAPVYKLLRMEPPCFSYEPSTDQTYMD